MIYGQPKVALLGDATKVIEGYKLTQGTDSPLCQPKTRLDPAYDLDD